MAMQSKRKAVAHLVSAAAVTAILGTLAPQASAATPTFAIHTQVPSSAEAGQVLQTTFSIENVGDQASNGTITFSDAAGPGLRAPHPSYSFGAFKSSVLYPQSPEEEFQRPSCDATGTVLTCTTAEALPPHAQLDVTLEVEVEGSASGSVTQVISVAGGGGSTVTVEEETRVAPPEPFAIRDFGARILGQLEAPLTQAGADPSELATTVGFQAATEYWFNLAPVTVPVEHVKDVTVHLPPGLIGNPTAVPTCASQLLNEAPSVGSDIPSCPEDSQVGVAYLALGAAEILMAPVYNMAAPPGAAAELGFSVFNNVVILDAHLRPGDQGIDIVSRNTSSTLPFSKVELAIWGDPASASHDRLRGACIERLGNPPAGNTGMTCTAKSTNHKAFLRMPTSCSGAPLQFGVEANTYGDPEQTVHASFEGPTVAGCEDVPFSPGIFVQPTTTSASSNSGVAVQLSLPQSSNPEGLAEADLKKAVVRMPEGMTIDPSSADGLQACADAQLRLGFEGPSECPEASKIGRVELHTPLLEDPIEGSIWLRTQNSMDPASGEMFRIAIELRDDRHGIDIKLPGQVSANPLTGQLTTTFDDAPQLPFESITLHFKAGARSPLSTPATCGVKTTVAELFSWAQPNRPVQRQVPFEISSGPEGTACTSRPFNPGFNAGVKSVQAGAYTPFLTTFSRDDADEQLERITVQLPPGLMGSLRGLPLCGEAQANAGTCAAASQIGTATAGAGVGPTPFYVTGGKVYMTGPYEGAPFGLSVVVPAKAGPFNLGTVVVRAKVAIDPHTAALTVTTDPLPKIVGGVPVDLRLVNVSIDRSKFTFNPTSCAPMAVKATVDSFEGASSPVESHFQVANCARLPFKPGFKASTRAKHTRKGGAYLHVTMRSAEGQADIREVHVELPKALPSRLSTLQKACTEAVFAANPASCPAESIVGDAVVHTPLLPVPLKGPAYFVSHGGAKFPELIMVLQGYGVTVELNGETFIDKKGITSSTFKTVPDVPFSTFSLTLPTGKHSALAGNGNFCRKQLVMPLRMVGQNGKQLERDVKLSKQGCKPEIYVVGHKAKDSHARLVVHVPSAGKLVASGKGIERTVVKAGKAGGVTVGVRLTAHGKAMIAKHAHRKLKVRVGLKFERKRQHEKHAKALRAQVTLLLG